MNRSDAGKVTAIGFAIGVLAQPVLANIVPVATPALRAGVALGCTVLAPLALYVAHLLGKIVPVVYQFAKFSAVGTLNTLIDLGILNLLILATGIASGVWYPVMKGFSFLIATTNSFFWNKHWTFCPSAAARRERAGAQKPAIPAEAAKFYSVAIAGWALNVAVASFVVNALGLPEPLTREQWANIGGLAGVGASFLWNFAGYKFWVFRNQ